MDILLDSEDKEIHAAIGKAIEAYGVVEGGQIFLIQTLLGVDYGSASIVFFNARSRTSLIDSLLTKTFEREYKKYWDSCNAFLDKLSRFRNAVVHWHPAVSLYMNDENERVARHEHTIMHPAVGKQFGELTPAHFPHFLDDCRFIYEEIMEFHAHLKADSHARSSDKFTRAIARRNKAALPMRTETPSKQLEKINNDTFSKRKKQSKRIK